MRQRRRRSNCPVHSALELFGDRWTLLVVRDLLRGRSTYTELLNGGEGIATNMLADRLARLVDDGIAEVDEHGRYALTEKGTDLLPVLIEITVWSAKHDPVTAPDAELLERAATDREALMRDVLTRAAATTPEG